MATVKIRKVSRLFRPKDKLNGSDGTRIVEDVERSIKKVQVESREGVTTLPPRVNKEM